MYLTFKRIHLILIVCISILSFESYAQEKVNVLFLSKYSNKSRVKQIKPNSYFKVKTIKGKKLKGKFDEVHENYFISTEKDTILINEIDWIKARKQLTKWERGLGIAGVFGGTIYSGASVIAALMIIAMEANYWVILAPAVIIPATIISFRTLAGRRYKMKRWKLEAQTSFN
jgi:hypothetical protein